MENENMERRQTNKIMNILYKNNLDQILYHGKFSTNWNYY